MSPIPFVWMRLTSPVNIFLDVLGELQDSQDAQTGAE
jgi:hypothetical protein